MARLRATLDPREVRKLELALEGIDPSRNPRAFNRGMTKAGLRIARNAARKQIIRGGRFGGTDAPPHPTRLTSRSGRLRASLEGFGAIDDSGLPKFLDVGTTVEYGPVHELGLQVATRSGSSFRMPRRAFLEPAVDAEFEAVQTDILAEWAKGADV